jgi:methionine-rich copper-binding protein CopC
MIMLVRRFVPALLLVMLMVFALAGTASAHSEFVSSDPKDGANLAKAPAKVTLVFSEELSPDGNLIKVTDARGAQVDSGDTALDLNDPNRVTLTITLKSGLGDGAYTINWKNMSADGHSLEGSLTFSVGAAAGKPAALPTTGTGDEAPLAALLVGGMLLAGVGMRLRGAAR